MAFQRQKMREADRIARQSGILSPKQKEDPWDFVSTPTRSRSMPVLRGAGASLALGAPQSPSQSLSPSHLALTSGSGWGSPSKSSPSRRCMTNTPRQSTHGSGFTFDEDMLQQLAAEEHKSKWESANRQSTLWGTALQDKIGSFDKPELSEQSKLAADPRRAKGKYASFRDARMTKDPLAKAMKAEKIERIQAEMQFNTPTVRTVLRIGDDVKMDDLVKNKDDGSAAGKALTANPAILTMMLQLDSLRGQVADKAEERKENAGTNLIKATTGALFGIKKVVSDKVHVEEKVEEEVVFERPLSESIEKFDEKMERLLNAMDFSALSPAPMSNQLRNLKATSQSPGVKGHHFNR
eukprot:gb/GFBE01066731.1/.p1 GENE.gb/GFBE01066731.1/~~gb/GFBE01066731.1/.p1  ORF type:complete len:352 (+),score=64.39 gb/GFBE01066731.1/:1-1056(+)